MSPGPAVTPFILNTFEMSTVSHITFGMWRHPDDRTADYTKLSYWTELARLLDRGSFDALFIADAVGQLDVYGGSAAAALADGAQTPVTDPLLAVSAMAAATEHLGFGITVSTTYEYPYPLARKFTTLDHYTDGRIAWNVVTSLLDSAAQNILGRQRQIPHDERYDIAQEFVDVAYKLWEGSWDDDAVVRDRATGVYVRPEGVRSIDHVGRSSRFPGPPVGTIAPADAGAVPGRDVRGRARVRRPQRRGHLPRRPDERHRAPTTDDIRARAGRAGRRPDAVKFIVSALVITGATDAEARERLEQLRPHYSITGALILFSAGTGIDWSRHDLDTPLEYLETDSGRSALLTYHPLDPTRQWTLRQIYETTLGHQRLIVGGPTTVADELERVATVPASTASTSPTRLMPGSFEDFIEHVVPVLRDRGRIRERIPGQTLRATAHRRSPPADRPPRGALPDRTGPVADGPGHRRPNTPDRSPPPLAER